LDTDFTYEYIPLRGISRETLKFYDIKTKINAEGKPISQGYKYPNGSYKIRNLEQKDFYSQGDIAKAGLFGRDKFAAGSHKYVTITEGELDAASLYQVLGSPVVSVQSSSSAVRDCGLDIAYLRSFERVYLAMDSDGPGKEATQGVARLFDYDKVYVVKFSNRKDANEYLANGESEELRNIWWNSKKYLPENIISSFAEFNKILQAKTKWGVAYPFPELSKMTYGIRTGETVLITAQEGVGKTELMHAIEYKILKETTANLGAIFLEEPERRHLQAIAGLELKQPVHLPDSNVEPSKVIAALKKILGQDERLHVYTQFGSDDPDTFLDAIRFLVSARFCKYILFDHINMAISGLYGEDERRKLDYFATKLETMVKELDFALILVSHVNDDGKTRSSRYIAKIADIRIDAVRNIIAEDTTERNTTYLTVSKNRYAGRTGPADKLIFDPSTYTFMEEWDHGFAEAYQAQAIATTEASRNAGLSSDEQSMGTLAVLETSPPLQREGPGDEDQVSAGVGVGENSHAGQEEGLAQGEKPWLPGTQENLGTGSLTRRVTSGELSTTVGMPILPAVNSKSLV